MKTGRQRFRGSGGPPRPALAAGFERTLGVQTFERDLGVIGEQHRVGDGAVPGLFGDQRVHPLADAAVGGMPCGADRSSMTCIASRAFMSM